jgi:aspartate-semialdehyde dehydrogenase
VPEVNGDDLAGHQGLVSTPNCSTTQLVVALKPLDDANPIARTIVDTYQSVSGTGAAAMDELRSQLGEILDGGAVRPSQYPHQIAFNVLPQVETFLDNGYTSEEMKMVDETRKIMHRPDLPVSATCARVPVMVSHSEAVHIEFEQPMTPAEVREILSDAPGVEVVDEPQAAMYPMPIDGEGRDPVYVGRIRQDVSHPNGIAMWIVSDNLRKGAALNAVQIAEEVIRNDLLQPSTSRSREESIASANIGRDS